MNIVTGGRNIILEFDDIIEYADYANSVPESNYSKTYSDKEFCKGSFADAVNQAQCGNPDYVRPLFDGIEVMGHLIERDYHAEIRDVAGEYFDVGDFLSGEPEVFRRNELCSTQPVVPVYASASMSCNVSQQTIINRGCTIIALCDLLAKQGYIVDLNLVHGIEIYGKKIYTKMKIETDPIDLDGAAFVIANPLWLRRLSFAVTEKITDRPYCCGYGAPIDYVVDDIFSDGVSGFYFVCSNNHAFNKINYYTLELSIKHLTKMIDEFTNNSSQVILG